MIPLWSIPMAIVTGNTLIVKPSERDPGATMIIAELCKKAGKTDGSILQCWLTNSQASLTVFSTSSTARYQPSMRFVITRPLKPLASSAVTQPVSIFSIGEYTLFGSRQLLTVLSGNQNGKRVQVGQCFSASPRCSYPTM